jgi:HNH endonuclease
MSVAIPVELERLGVVILTAAVLFYVILPLWAAREGIAWGMKRGTVAIVGAIVVHQVAIVKGVQPGPAILAALVLGWLVEQLVPARSRNIPTHVKRKVIGEYEARTGKKYTAREVDHVWPYSRGGSHTSDNLRVIPKAHNRRKGARKPSPKDWF